MIKFNSNNKYFTLIGSRNISSNEYNILLKISKILLTNGYIGRSGGARGSDSTLFDAHLKLLMTNINSNVEIYLPFNNFNNLDENTEYCFLLDNMINAKKAYAMAKDVHPLGKSLSGIHLKFHARNCYQILGKSLSTPSNLVIYCSDEICKRVKGGTATAVNIARNWNVDTYNIRIESELNELLNRLREV